MQVQYAKFRRAHILHTKVCDNQCELFTKYCTAPCSRSAGMVDECAESPGMRFNQLEYSNTRVFEGWILVCLDPSEVQVYTQRQIRGGNRLRLTTTLIGWPWLESHCLWGTELCWRGSKRIRITFVSCSICKRDRRDKGCATIVTNIV